MENQDKIYLLKCLLSYDISDPVDRIIVYHLIDILSIPSLFVAFYDRSPSRFIEEVLTLLDANGVRL